MKIGASLFTIALGAILTFAVDWSPSGIDLDTVGVILMIVGGILLMISLAIMANRGSRGAPLEGQGGIVEERRIYNDDPMP